MKKVTGFTIIEIMVAMVIGLILTGIIISIFLSNKQAYRNNEHFQELNENIRFAVAMISNDLINAGFYGGLTYLDPIYMGELSIGECTGDSYTKNYSSVGTDSTASATSSEYPIWGKQAGSATEISCLSNVASGSSILSVKSVSGQTTDDADTQAGSIYIRTGKNEGQFFVGSAAKPSIANSTNMNWKYNNHIYYIYEHRLMRRTLQVKNGDPEWSDEVLVGPRLPKPDDTQQELEELEEASGIENMQIVYGVDTDGDGVPDYYDNASSLTLSDWQKITEIKIYLLARSAKDPTYIDKKNYDLGGVAIAAKNDNFHRKVFSTTVFLRNQWYLITGGI